MLLGQLSKLVGMGMGLQLLRQWLNQWLNRQKQLGQNPLLVGKLLSLLVMLLALYLTHKHMDLDHRLDQLYPLMIHLPLLMGMLMALMLLVVMGMEQSEGKLRGMSIDLDLYGQQDQRMLLNHLDLVLLL